MSSSAFLDGKSWPRTSLLVTAVFLGAIGCASALANPQPPKAPPEEALRFANALSDAFAYAADTIRPSVVAIRAVRHARMSGEGRGRSTPQPQFPDGLPFDEDLLRRFFGERSPNRPRPQQGLGSGVIVSADGYILTNNHVAGNADEVVVTLSDGKEHRAQVVGKDPLSDLAVIRIKADGLPAARLGDSDGLRVGEWVVAAGNPFGLNDTITAGIVSAKGRSNMRIVEYEDFIQTDAAINPGNSGGPLVNLRGEVVGINTAIATRTGGNSGIGFAIPISMAKSIMESLIGTGTVTRGWLGVGIQPLDEDMARSFGYDSTEGVLIGSVIKDGPAEAAGLKQGDIVTGFNGAKTKDMTQFRNLVAASEPNSKVKLEVFRDGRTESITVKLAQRTDDEALAGAGPTDADELGLTVANLTAETRRPLGLDRDVTGVVITEVDPTGVAYRAGLRQGQLILDVHGTPVSSVAEFRSQIARQDLKKGIRLRIQEGETQVFVLLRAED